MTRAEIVIGGCGFGHSEVKAGESDLTQGMLHHFMLGGAQKLLSSSECHRTHRVQLGPSGRNLGEKSNLNVDISPRSD